MFGVVTGAAEHLAEADARVPVVLGDMRAVVRHLSSRGRRAGRSVLLLDSRNRLLADDPCDGADAAAIATTILRQALSRHATAAILVRETRGGAEAAESDRAVFRTVRTRAEPLSVLVHDLVVYCPGGEWVSLAGAV